MSTPKFDVSRLQKKFIGLDAGADARTLAELKGAFGDGPSAGAGAGNEEALLLRIMKNRGGTGPG